jgi:hypothetical protein
MDAIWRALMEAERDYSVLQNLKNLNVETMPDGKLVSRLMTEKLIRIQELRRVLVEYDQD